MVALTFVRGRVDQSTTESTTGGITRVAGQFTSPFLSCPVRASGTDRVRFTVGSKFTATSGAVLVFFDPDNAYNAGGQAANGRLFSWYLSAAERIELEFTKAGSLLTARRLTGSAGATITVASGNFAAGDATCALIAWDATKLYVAVNGGTIASVANASVPVGLPASCDIGSLAATNYMDAAYGAVVALSAPPTQAQWTALAALKGSRPPAPLEQVGTVMTGLWYGAHTRVHDFATAHGIDLYNTSGIKPGHPLGWGSNMPQNRMVETPLRDGAAYVDTRMLTRKITLPIALFDELTAAAFYALRRALVVALNPLPGPGVLTFAPDVQVYETDAIYESGMQYDTPAGLYLQRPPLVFACMEPAVRVAVLGESAQTIPQAGLVIPLTIPMDLAPSATTFSLTNSGDMRSWPIFVVTAGANGCEGIQFENETTEKVFKIDGYSLAAGRVLTIDMGERTVTLDDGTNLMGYRTADSEMWPLEPEEANSITASLDAGSATFTAQYQTRLLGI